MHPQIWEIWEIGVRSLALSRYSVLTAQETKIDPVGISASNQPVESPDAGPGSLLLCIYLSLYLHNLCVDGLSLKTLLNHTEQPQKKSRPS